MSPQPTIAEGALAPAFTLLDQNGKAVALADFTGKRVLLYSYPRALTPGCTVEAKDFSCLAAEFAALAVTIVGLSPDPIKSLKSFEAKEQLAICLLSDPDHAVLERYGFWGEKMNYGKVSRGVIRSTALIGQDGRIIKLWKNVKAKGHAARVLADLKKD